MNKIGSYIEETDELLGVTKSAFIPASAVQGGQGPTGGQPQQGGGDQDQGQQAPPQGQGSQGGGDSSGMLQQLMQMVQQLPPEAQQQAQQAIQQIQQMPPDQQGQAAQQLAQGIQQMMQSGGGQQSTIGGDPNAGQAQQGAQQQPGAANTAGHVRAENELDNKTVTLTIRELMDLTSGGSATKSLLAVKQLADQHNQKMQQNQQKQQMDAQKQQLEQQAAAQGMQSGGLYSQAPDMSGKAPQQSSAPAAPPAQ